MIVGPTEYYNITIDLMDYFVKEEGWKQEYAHQVLVKQCSDIGLEMQRRKRGLPTKAVMLVTRKLAAEGLEYFKQNADGSDYRALVKRLVDKLSPYKRPDDIRRMNSQLGRIINRYVRR